MNLKGVVISGLSPLADIVGDMSLQPYWQCYIIAFMGQTRKTGTIVKNWLLYVKRPGAQSQLNVAWETANDYDAVLFVGWVLTQATIGLALNSASKKTYFKTHY